VTKPLRVMWRWSEKDYGFRFRTGTGKRRAEYYQAQTAENFYHVPASLRKLEKERIEELAPLFVAPTAPTIVANPWDRYDEKNSQLIQASNGKHCLNWAGCLDRDEIERRETDGINRAREFVFDYAKRRPHSAISLDTILNIHKEMFSDISPLRRFEWVQA
jgi:hypothetical protein